ncbi:MULTISPECIES: hypothetical protein [Xanthomonas translucens group]|nr:hypothetical protein [Xanthomonas translucens]
MVHRYIELNPVRAAMTTAAEDDQWSSARFSPGIAAHTTLSPHPAYLALGADPAGRATSYRQWLNQGVTGDELHAIRLPLQQERALSPSALSSNGSANTESPGVCPAIGATEEIGDRLNSGV